jgi:hypothetical protein
MRCSAGCSRRRPRARSTTCTSRPPTSAAAAGCGAERRVEHDVDWRVERDAADRQALRIEDDSRQPGHLASLGAAAEREHGRAGPITTAQDAERRRREWVKDQQTAAGGERARSLGWTDVYTFTKAMGERVVEELTSGSSPDAPGAAAIPVSIVRPSIIESALLQPHPGWIEGFKMAEPIILAYGRGEFPEFPAAPDSIVDIVPVDLVVNALLAVCATQPAPGVPQYFHVSSGARNALTFRWLYELVREHFDRHPFDLGERGAVQLPTWRFPGSQRVERVLAQGERAHRLADRALSLAPRSDRVREFSRDLDRTKRRLDFLRRYLDLYRSYTQVELQFIDDRTLACTARSTPPTSRRSVSTRQPSTGRTTSATCTARGDRADAPLRRHPQAPPGNRNSDPPSDRG